jgi:hypothetical protein
LCQAHNGIERERGLEFREDLFSPFALVFERAGRAVVICAVAPHDAAQAGRMRAAEIDAPASEMPRPFTATSCPIFAPLRISSSYNLAI